jgi:hypothetical protein
VPLRNLFRLLRGVVSAAAAAAAAPAPAPVPALPTAPAALLLLWLLRALAAAAARLHPTPPIGEKRNHFKKTENIGRNRDGGEQSEFSLFEGLKMQEK